MCGNGGWEFSEFFEVVFDDVFECVDGNFIVVVCVEYYYGVVFVIVVLIELVFEIWWCN